MREMASYYTNITKKFKQKKNYGRNLFEIFTFKNFYIRIKRLRLKAGRYWKLHHKFYIYTWTSKQEENFKILYSLICIKILK